MNKAIMKYAYIFISMAMAIVIMLSSRSLLIKIVIIILQIPVNRMLDRYFFDKFYHGHIKEAYPIDAIKLNTSIMVELIKKEYEINGNPLL